ncbi:hypothetical protein F2P79_005044 [Pimephales promelas]|nr:hypothetical protein F2P79_005044 [Pimephales promelas]
MHTGIYSKAVHRDKPRKRHQVIRSAASTLPESYKKKKKNTRAKLTNQSASCISEGKASYNQEIISPVYEKRHNTDTAVWNKDHLLPHWHSSSVKLLPQHAQHQ